MRIVARVANRAARHEVTLATDGREQRLAIPAQAGGRGSAVNGGELMCLALATCYCNDLYREAMARDAPIASVEVEVEADFAGPGEPARSVRYRVRLSGDADDAMLHDLARRADAVAEVQNTLRGGIAVQLVEATVSSGAGRPPPVTTSAGNGGRP